MADMLATSTDLANMPGMADVPAATADTLLRAATSVVQATACGQRMVAVADDAIELLGTIDSWLSLPQRPVTTVTSVELDGQALAAGTDYRRFGSRLWRTAGWAASAYEPSVVAVTYSHGYDVTDQGIELARSAALMLAAGAASVTPGATSESIDDYQVVYRKMAEQMEGAESLQNALRSAYCIRAGLVRLG